MKKIAMLLLAGSALVVATGASAQTRNFTFSETFDNGYDYQNYMPVPVTITGSFSGTLNGNTITDFSNIAFALNGVAVAPVNGKFFTASYNPNSGFSGSGTGQLTLDNSANNVLFIDSDYANYDYSFRNYFYSIPLNPDYGYAGPTLLGYNNYLPGQTTTNLSIELLGAGVPEPSTWALMILGFGAVGGAMRRRASVRTTVSLA